MLTPVELVAIFWVLLLWTTVGAAIYRWGPGRSRRHVNCPERQREADLVVLHAEGNFGELRDADVAWCSLFGPEPVRCNRACLAVR